ncbi:MAG: orotidine-5'-phosphate decarboxylase [Mariprofundaceae bacterium]|nr:orotidine-5'-phosphate decarboxylase [Mariprofundaceae bacterium]
MNMKKTMSDRLMVALDVQSAEEALHIRDTLADSVGWLKVGLRLFVGQGPALIAQLQTSHRIFLDLKFHDIPNTVAQAIESAGNLGVDMVNVHAGGGLPMLEAAAQAAAAFPSMQLIAVTVLTSDTMPQEQALALALQRAKLAKDAGLHGVVCSVHEAASIKALCGQDFITVTPGIRWGNQNSQDQQRIADPKTAVESGSDYLVIGRPILQADNPKAAAQEAAAMMATAKIG